MVIVNIKNGQTAYCVHSREINEGKINEFLTIDNKQWLLALSTGEYRECQYGVDVFLTYKKAKSVMESRIVQSRVEQIKENESRHLNYEEQRRIRKEEHEKFLAIEREFREYKVYEKDVCESCKKPILWDGRCGCS